MLNVALSSKAILVALTIVYGEFTEVLGTARNMLGGPLPPTMYLMTNLGTFVASILAETFQWKSNLTFSCRIEELVSQENQHTGTIPSALYDMTSLSKLDHCVCL